MNYQVISSRQAAKEIKKLPKVIIPKVYSKISSLAEDPRPPGVVKLTDPSTKMSKVTFI